jgi:hypothetical protein
MLHRILCHMIWSGKLGWWPVQRSDLFFVLVFLFLTIDICVSLCKIEASLFVCGVWNIIEPNSRICGARKSAIECAVLLKCAVAVLVDSCLGMSGLL